MSDRRVLQRSTAPGVPSPAVAHAATARSALAHGRVSVTLLSVVPAPQEIETTARRPLRWRGAEVKGTVAGAADPGGTAGTDFQGSFLPAPSPQTATD